MKEWILLDTETTGIIDPIHILEVFAYRMRGSKPVDEGCHVFLDHDVEVPPEATAIHGYTRELLSQIGINPQEGHRVLEEYVGDRPVCSHNLPYDLTRCLLPERQRLGKPARIGDQGFCTLQLFRRSLEPMESYKLDLIRQRYQLNFPAHSARGDVLTVAHMLDHHVFPRLTKGGITTFEEIAEFAARNPISLCRSSLGLAPLPKAKPRVVGGYSFPTLRSKKVATTSKQGYLRLEGKKALATQKQKDFAKALGAELPEGCSKKVASKTIEKLLAEQSGLGRGM